VLLEAKQCAGIVEEDGLDFHSAHPVMTRMCGTGTTGYPAVMIEMTSIGTPVETWTEWGRRLPLLEVEDCPALILVARHPDDETLGLGATAAVLSGRGVIVQ